MDFDADVIVVGCGVAGATVAETAASLGSRVLLLEEHDQAGVPSHCSGHVGINSMKRLGFSLPSHIIKNQIRGAVFHSPSGQVLHLERQTPVTWVLDRIAFDEHLANRAQKAGAQLKFSSRATSALASDDDGFHVQVSAGAKPQTFSCKLIVDCEGASPTLTRLRSKGERRKPMWVNSAQVHLNDVEDINEDLVEVYLGSAYAPGFFAWLIPWRDGSAKVGLATREGNPRLFLERFMKRHPIASKKLKNVQRGDVSYHPIPLGGPIPKTYSPGMLNVGDSAQQVKATTGGGIVFSLICGRIAGRVAYDASRVGDISESFLADYETRWKREIGRDLNAMRRIRRMLFRLPDRRLEKIFSIARTFDVASILSKADDIDMQGRTLAKLGLDPRLTISLLSSSILSLPFIAESSRTEA
ncbi:MAG: NAD(P)/FAD-dependent oxidoreductase [Candidatus Bathyarchaeia archaeon]